MTNSRQAYDRAAAEYSAADRRYLRSGSMTDLDARHEALDRLAAAEAAGQEQDR